VGTLEEAPVTFRVGVKQGGEEATVFERTVTTGHRWENARIDLLPYAGRKVTLSLVLASETPAALGFWGTPVVRDVPPASGSPAAAQRPQGVIFIWADTLRRDHLPFYGYGRPTAPVLARMAAEGTVFEDCIAQASWTKASGPSLMTSLYPSTHTVQSFNDLLPSSATTLAEVYRKAGHATLALTSIPFVGKFSNMHQGYEELYEPGAYPEVAAAGQKSARAQVDRLLPWLEAHRDVPFFVLLHVRDPHSPFRPYPPYDTLWADPARAAEHERQGERVKPFIKSPNMRPRVMPSRAELVEAGLDPDAWVAHERDWYDGSIRGMDAEMGRLRERLQSLGLDRRTVVAFVADHGEEFLEHGRTFHQQSVYGELANVPLFFWGPGFVPAGVRVAPTVQNIDLMPTLLELSGLPPPGGIQGASLLPLMRGDTGAWDRPAIIEAVGRIDPTSTDQNEAVAIIANGWKLVERPARGSAPVRHELYDHRNDPLDRTDLAQGQPERVARLARELEAWRRKAVSARLKPDSALAGTMSAEDLERLRALGYVQ
jgi:arylsulfatase A-like enzyme